MSGPASEFVRISATSTVTVIPCTFWLLFFVFVFLSNDLRI
jgi:hypothetical protein